MLSLWMLGSPNVRPCKKADEIAVAVDAREPYRIWLRFADGTEGEVDLRRWASLGVFRAWSDPDLFRSVTVRPYGAVAWGGGRRRHGDLPAQHLHGPHRQNHRRDVPEALETALCVTVPRA